jgi:drug/metabolite transporter (DMT)-like permease
MTTSKALSAHLSLILCNVVWACDYPLYNLTLGRYISPLAMVSASLAVAALWSLLPLLWEKGERIDAADRIKIFGAAILMGIVRKLCMMFGLSRTSPIDGSIISTTTPLLVLILSVVVGLENFTKLRISGLMLGMAGAIATILSNSSHAQSGVIGNILILTSSCVSACYLVFFKRLVTKYHITTLLRWIYCSSAIIMLPIGAHDIITTDFAAMNPQIIFATLFVLIVQTYLPNLLLNYALKYVAPTVSSIYAYLQPIVAITLAIIMGLDRLRLDIVLFALVIFAGVGMVTYSYHKEEKTLNTK